MTIRRIGRVAAIIAAAALLVTSVGCSTPAPQAPAEPQTDHSHTADTSATDAPVTDAPVNDSHSADGTTTTKAPADGSHGDDGTTTTKAPADGSHDVGTSTTQSTTAPNGSHKPTTNKTTTNKPTANKTTNKPTTNKPADKVHDHQSPTAMDVTYTTESGGKFTLIIKDCQGKWLLERKGLTKKASSQQIAPGIMELTWVKSNDPGDYERLYVNHRTCQVSDVIAGSQATDGNRIVYAEILNGKLNVIVRDLFNSNGYAKVTVINEAYTKGKFTVKNITKRGKDQAIVSFLIDQKGAHRARIFSLYEKGEKKPDYLS